MTDEQKLMIGKHVYSMMETHAIAWEAFGTRQNIGASISNVHIGDDAGSIVGIWEISVKRVSLD